MTQQVPPPLRVAAQPLLREEDVAAFHQRIDPAAWLPGTVTRVQGAEEDRTVRSCDVQPVAHPDVVEAIGGVVRQLNDQLFGFELADEQPPDPLSFMRYGVGGRFDWHADVGGPPPSASRKLSFSLQLSPADAYDGGDLDFAHLHLGDPEGRDALPQVLRPLGTLVVFPSFLVHRVSPVTRGERLALVGWLHGPPFR